MDIKRHLKAALKQLGFQKPRKAQIVPMNALDERRDAIVIAATGSGKQVIYETVGLAHPGQVTIVIEPLLALLYHQVKTLQTHGVSADYIDSTRSSAEVQKILDKARKSRLNFLYVTPEQLQGETFTDAMQHTDVYMVVVDECHCITEWGNTFREAYLHIGDFIVKLQSKPVICACSATVLTDTTDIIRKSLRMERPLLCRSDLRRENLVLLKKDVTCEKRSLEDRLEARIKVLYKQIKKYHKDGSVLIFAQTTAYVDALYNMLDEQFPSQVTRYHAKMKPERLKRQMELDFLQGRRRIMVATSAFGMGVDVPNVELVIHFNTPISMTDYIQQIGRAGRDGRKAHCVLFYDRSGDDRAIMQSFIRKAEVMSFKAAKQLKTQCQQMVGFVQSDRCMVCDVLHYQGQDKGKTCKYCTNCAKKRRGEPK